MNSYVLPLVAAALAFGAVMVVSLEIVGRHEQLGMRRSLALVLRIGAVNPADADLASVPSESFVASLVRSVADGIVGQRTRARLRRHLAWAGQPTTEALANAVDRKVIYLIAGGCLGLLAGMVYGGWVWLVLPVSALVGYFLPDVHIYNKGQRRTQEIQRGLPDALDLLNLCVESGLSLQAGLSRIAASQSGPVAAEFGRVLQEMQLGVSRADAFESMSQRTKQEDLQRFVAAILQVDKLGIPVAAVLREQASDMRAKRHSRARELAQKVPVKILAPLMLCFLPGLFIIILGPAVLIALDVFVGL